MKNLILALVCVIGAGVAASHAVNAASPETKDSAKGTFTLPALPYAAGDLADVIDVKTMEIHHGKHHQAYVDKLNEEVAKDARIQGKSLDDIIGNISKYSVAVRNNAGGHWNHSFFWPLMTKGGNDQISPELQKAITDSFGSMDEFKSKFEAAGTGQFGSGWAWLIVNKSGKLEITATPNQDNPLMNDAKVKGTPILGNDVWEHAYYLKYQNKRADYLKAWWSIVDWSKVSAHYADATKK